MSPRGGGERLSEIGLNYKVIRYDFVPDQELKTRARRLMTKTCFVYSFLEPVQEQIKDDIGTPPLATVPVQLSDGRRLEAAILGTANTVTGFRLSIGDLNNETLDPEDYKRFFNLRKLMLDCIRMAYDPRAEWFMQGDGIFTAWNFIETGQGPSLSLRITQPVNPEYRVNAEGIGRLFAVPRNLRPIIHLMADGGDLRLPVQFRFLSLYKIIEMHYKISSNKTFNEFAAPFLADFQLLYPDIKTNTNLCATLARLRNRCAHIELAKGDLGFSHFEAEHDELFKIMPVMRHMAVRCITVNYPDSPIKFSATPAELDRQVKEMVSRGEQPVRVV